MPFSLRLDRDTEAMIRRLSGETGQSKSAVVREAIAEYIATRESRPASAVSALDRLKSFVGIVASGGANYSVHTHAKYREQLRRKHRAGRPR